MNKLHRFAMAAVTALLLTACGSRITPDNYAKLEAGMTREQVYDILGKPTEVSGKGIGSLTMSSETWKGPAYRIHITFGNDKVAIKSISRPDEEEK